MMFIIPDDIVMDFMTAEVTEKSFLIFYRKTPVFRPLGRQELFIA